MHVLINAPCACDTGPSGPQSSTSLDEFTFEDEKKLGSLVCMNREPSSWLESYDLHLPAVRRCDILHEHARGERRRPPGNVSGVYTRQRTAFKSHYPLLLAAQRARSAAGASTAREPRSAGA